jgi:hypothetical protein
LRGAGGSGQLGPSGHTSITSSGSGMLALAQGLLLILRSSSGGGMLAGGGGTPAQYDEAAEASQLLAQRLAAMDQALKLIQG